MPFYECPNCRLTIRLSNRDAALNMACPRCGEQVEGHPRSLFAVDLPSRLRVQVDRPDREHPHRGTPA
jgi:predicted RNA-binding Zn-ribbon protein involved in translation (DUF1610 family)